MELCGLGDPVLSLNPAGEEADGFLDTQDIVRIEGGDLAIGGHADACELLLDGRADARDPLEVIDGCVGDGPEEAECASAACCRTCSGRAGGRRFSRLPALGESALQFEDASVGGVEGRPIRADDGLGVRTPAPDEPAEKQAEKRS